MPDRAVGGMPTRDLSFALLYTPLLYRTLMLCRKYHCLQRLLKSDFAKSESHSHSHSQLFHSYSHSHSHSLPSWVPRGAPTSENAPSHGHKTYRDRDLRREEHLSEPTHTLGRHRAREWQPVQDKRFLLARETSTRSRDLASSRCIEA